MDQETAKEEAKEIAIAQLNKRNTETVEIVLRQMQKEINEIKIVVASLNNTMGGLIERQNQLEQKVNIQKVQLMGLGPSVKG
jgi:RecA/RadA recombinase